jgi:hypothetical protein
VVGDVPTPVQGLIVAGGGDSLGRAVPGRRGGQFQVAGEGISSSVAGTKG